MLHNDGEVLVATEVNSARLLDQPQGGLASGLWPAIAVEVGEQPVARIAVEMHRTAEGGL